jgi:hypothetical protein
MTICGAWHGTGVNFLIWGLYNGFFLSLNHQLKNFNFKIYHFFSWLITFVIVVIGFAIFRSNSFENLMSLFKSLFLFNNLSLPVSFAALIPNLNNIQFDGIYPNNLVDFKIVFLLILIVIFITFFCENSQNIVGKQFFVQYGNYSPQKSIVRIFKDKKYFDFFLGILLLICSLFYSTDIQNFIYFVF